MTLKEAIALAPPLDVDDLEGLLGHIGEEIAAALVVALNVADYVRQYRIDTSVVTDGDANDLLVALLRAKEELAIAREHLGFEGGAR